MMATSQAAHGAATLPPAKVAQQPKLEEEITPATIEPETDSDFENDSFGFQAEQDEQEEEVPQQLSAGLYPPPTEEELRSQTTTQTVPPPPRSVTPAAAAPAPAAAPAQAPSQGPSKEGNFTFGETFFVFDYDDTILPSTWIQRQGLRLDNGSRPTPEQMAALGEVAEIAGKTLRMARQHGTVVFVTNAERGWIELSCRKFMPTLAPMLENVRMISARTTYEGPQAPSPLDWKLRAFEDQIAHQYGADKLADPQARKNVLSLGDGIHEREALLASTSSLPNCASKSLKFVERPHISQIIKQHELISSAFGNIVQHTGNLDLCIQCP